MTVLLQLLQNIALVVLLATVQQWLGERWFSERRVPWLLSGVLYGGVGIAAMASPLTFAPGYIFDGRSVILTIAGLFGGPWVASVSAVICSAYRLWLGGVGAPTGVFVILEAAAMGVVFHELRRRGFDVMRPAALLGLGVLVHAIMLWGQVYGLGIDGFEAVKRVGLPIMTLFPLGTLLVARLILDQERKQELQASLEEQATQLEEALDALVDVVSQMVETRDPTTAGHQRRVARLAVAIAEQLGLETSEVHTIRSAALIHDVGKIAVPAEVLSKPGALSSLERRLVRKHVDDGYEIVCRARLGDTLAEYVHQHHERCDGSGYPRGLNGGELLMGSKILMVADVVEAMCSHRPYRAACGADAALEEIRQGSGKLYDRIVSEACLEVFSRHGFVFD